MDRQQYDAIRCDVDYAVRQLRRFGDVERALDALERVQAELMCAAPVVVVPDVPMGESWEEAVQAVKDRVASMGPA